VRSGRACCCDQCEGCFSLDESGCGFVGTAVCVELLDADELDGVGEEGREDGGVVVEEESV
jgi:hypothetical protein